MQVRLHLLHRRLRVLDKFVRGREPHRRILDYFADLLSADGVLVLAIENQLGLKYFGASAEDHTGVMFDGIEGYPRRAAATDVRLHGAEVGRLERALPGTWSLFFSWPDYKLPSCVVSERMLDEVEVSELMGASRRWTTGNRGRRRRSMKRWPGSRSRKNRLIPRSPTRFLSLRPRGQRPTSPRTGWPSRTAIGGGRVRPATRFFKDGPGGFVRQDPHGGCGAAEGT